jgi:putative glutamine amidotransferase
MQPPPHQPRIAVTSDFNPGTMERFGGDEAHQFLNARYTQAVADSGGLPWLLPVGTDPNLAAAYLDGVDGLLLTGCGRHLNPATYDQDPKVELTLMSPHKQNLEFALVRTALARQLPIFGICGGMQSLNVVLGGSLIQRIANEIPNPLAHMQTTKATHTVHDVDVKAGSRLAQITGASILATNSAHTQSLGRVADGLVVSARTKDGIIEAVETASGHPHPWLLAVQWHPEYLYPNDRAQMALFDDFIRACASTPKRQY